MEWRKNGEWGVAGLRNTQAKQASRDFQQFQATRQSHVIDVLKISIRSPGYSARLQIYQCALYRVCERLPARL